MAIQSRSSLKVLEDVSHVSPPPGSVPTASIPPSFLDIKWLGYSPMQRLFFYEFPCPTLHFMQTTLPHLKTSLSLTLQHFFPLAGKLLFPPPPQMPYVLYTKGCSVSLIVNESTADFSFFSGDCARHIQELQALVPQLPSASMSSNGYMEKSLMAIQFTVFPMAGISIGVAFCHGVADGRALAHFMKSWASFHKSQGNLTCLNNFLPNFNRDLIKDPLGLTFIFMKDLGERGDFPSFPVDKFLVNFVIKQCQVELLKDWITRKCMEEDGSEPLKMSTFVVTCSYLWVCKVKLSESGTQHLSSGADGDAFCHFIFFADCRDRLKLPTTYFGNCISICFAAAKKSELAGENGFLVATQAIGREVMELDKGPLKEEENWPSRLKEIINSGHLFITAASSPKFGFYNIDFGWGRPKKTNVTHIGSFRSISVTDNREEEGGLEFGLALARNDLDRYNAIFQGGSAYPSCNKPFLFCEEPSDRLWRSLFNDFREIEFPRLMRM